MTKQRVHVLLHHRLCRPHSLANGFRLGRIQGRAGGPAREHPTGLLGPVVSGPQPTIALLNGSQREPFGEPPTDEIS